MINVFLNSIAGKKTSEKLNIILIDLLSQVYIPAFDKKIIRHTLEVADQGNYPSPSYYADFYEKSNIIVSIAELRVFALKLKDFYAKESLVSETLAAINDSNSKQELESKLSVALDKSAQDRTDEDLGGSVKTYSEMGERPDDAGFLLGISEIDECTNGFQPGTVGSVCAFISEGKSTTWISAIYKNIKSGKKGLLMSLEMHPDLVSMQFLARFLYEEKSMDIKADELIQRKLTDEKKKLVASYEEEFKELMNNLVILDESCISEGMMKNPKLVSALFKRVESKLGGLDFTVWDHVNQFDLMFKDLGNTCIRTITSATKTYKNQNELPLFTGFAVQCNREGWKQAKKREGKYAINAISDLNEVERSSTYVIFLFTSEDMRMTQETKATLAKNRLGSLLVEPVVTTFNPSVMVVGDLIDKVQYDDDLGNLSGADFSSFSDDDF